VLDFLYNFMDRLHKHGHIRGTKTAATLQSPTGALFPWLSRVGGVTSRKWRSSSRLFCARTQIRKWLEWNGRNCSVDM